MTVLSFVASPIAGALSHRIPIRVLLGVGLAFVGVGLLLIHGVDTDSTWTALLAGFLLAGVGIGITNPGIGQAAIAVVPVEKSGMGSGINTTFRQVGIATGVAGLGAVFQSRVDSKLAELLPGAHHGLGEAVASGGVKAAALAAPSGRARPYVEAAKSRLRPRLQRDRPDRGDRLLRRRRRRVPARPLEGLRAADRRRGRPGGACGRAGALAAEPAGGAAGAEVLLLGDEVAEGA